MTTQAGKPAPDLGAAPSRDTAGPGAVAMAALLAPELVMDWDGGGTSPALGARLRLAGSHCSSCGRVEFPARPVCPACQASMERSPLGPDARLVGFSAVLHQPPGARVTTPYDVGLALFEGGIAVIGLLVGGAAGASAPRRLDEPVETVAVRVDDTTVTFGYRVPAVST